MGVPELGALAAAKHGVPLERLALVPGPRVVTMAIDGVDLVVVAAPTAPDATIRALMARARQRRCVLVPTTAWAGCDVVIERTGQTWPGLVSGWGWLRQQTVGLFAVGRGKAAQPGTGHDAVAASLGHRAGPGAGHSTARLPRHRSWRRRMSPRKRGGWGSVGRGAGERSTSRSCGPS